MKIWHTYRHSKIKNGDFNATLKKHVVRSIICQSVEPSQENLVVEAHFLSCFSSGADIASW